MKTLDELVKEMAGKTHLQQAELVGAEVQLVGELTQIMTDYLACVQTESPGPLMLVAHEGELLKKQLLEYSVGDGVRMTTRFTMMSSDPDCYHFDLVSIVRVYTREAKERKKQEAEEKRKAEEKNSSSCFVATAAYGSPNPAVLILLEYRDRILTKAVIGSVVVRFYYAMSPQLAQFIATSYRRRLIARLFLRPVVFFARRQLEALRKRK
jgi:hypothetical protein